VKRLPILILICGLAIGCGKEDAEHTSPISLVPSVTVAHPEFRDIRRTVAQPGLIQPYEQTAIFSKVAGFVQKWCVDIGARVKKDELLVELLVPELEEEHKQKEALVEQEKAMVNQANTLVHVAESNLQAADDAVAESQASLERYEADVKFRKGEVTRLTGMVKDGTINPENLAETQNALGAMQSALAAGQAGVRTKKSQREAADAQVAKSKADLMAAEACVKVVEADERRLAAMFAYTKITAPYDGVITSRNVNTGDFVRPASGDSSGGEDTGSNPGRSAPLFVVARTDPVMFVIGVPEIDSPYVAAGTKATLRVMALADREFDVPVTRTSLALHSQSRTLQAEIDLSNPQNELLPGMYAYGSIDVERLHVRAIPKPAIVEVGNRMCCYTIRDGKAVRMQIQSGIGDGNWVEVLKQRTFPTSGEPGSWEDFTGSEQIIDSDLSEISEGKQVSIAPAK
jgi:HlyD family secretion protein